MPLTPEDMASIKAMMKDAIHEYIMETSEEETPADTDADGVPDAVDPAPADPDQYTASVPAATNAAPPVVATRATERYNATDTTRIGDDQLRIQVRKMADQIKELIRVNGQLVEANNAIADRYNMSSREQVLTQLEAEGYELDRAEELDYCKDMDTERFNMHVDRIRKYNRQSIVGSPFLHSIDNGGRTVPGKSNPDDPDDIAGIDPEEVVRYCAKEGIKDHKTAVTSFLDARREARKTKRA